MLIRQLKIYSPNLEAQRQFYQEVLGFSLQDGPGNAFSIAVGHTRMIFESKQGTAPVHFAFNIPSNQIGDAHRWLKQRTSVLEWEGREIHPFPHWEAEAIYFRDADGNIGELIARKKLQHLDLAPFGTDSLISVSEIAHGGNGIQAEIELLQTAGLKIHSGGAGRFCSVGDEEGLFILVNTDEKATWFPTSDPVLPANFELEIELGTQKQRYACLQGTFSRIN